MCGKKMETHGLVKKIERYRLSSSNELTVLVSWANNRNYEEIKNLQKQIS